jgi:hypothetical protein
MKLNRQFLLKYLIKLYNKENGSFNFSEYSLATILSTDFAVSQIFLINEIDYLKERYQHIRDYLLRAKQPNGYFIDTDFDLAHNNTFHKNDYVVPQFSYFTYIALDILGMHFEDIPFIEKYLDSKTINLWLNELEWGNFWYESNKIMFMMYFFSYLIKYGNESHKERAGLCINEFFKVLNAKQDKNTGFWGTDFNNNDLQDGCFGAAHIYLFYDYYGIEIQYPQKIIESTLTLHSENGLIGSKEGGACEDYDVIDIYHRILKQSIFKKEEILDKLLLMKKKINCSQHTDGGFSYKLYDYSLKNIIKFRKDKIKYKYSSWEKMSTPIYLPDSWGSYFKVLSLIVIDRIIQGKLNNSFKSYNLPGWGFIDKDKYDY